MDAVVAVFSDWGIGAKGTQQVVLRADRARFASLTKDAAVIVGRTTLSDFPGGKPLKGRRNIVITRQELKIEGAEVVHSAKEALELASGLEKCFVIGGESVYHALIPYTKRIFVTKIELAPPSTAFFPNLDADPAWRCTDDGERLEENGVTYRFCVYERPDLSSVPG